MSDSLPLGSESLWRSDAHDAAGQPLRVDVDVDVAIVGGGITGLTTAVLLTRAGARVAVLEARRIGAGATGGTTAKVSLLQGTTASSLRKSIGDAATMAYLEANRVGQKWLLDRAAEAACDLERVDAITYTCRDDHADAVRREADVLEAAGHAVRLTRDVGLPFPVVEAVVMGEQAQLDPMPYLASLAAEVTAAGSSVYVQARVRSASWTGRPRLVIDTGASVRADRVVIATGSPFLDRGLYFGRLEPSRSYLLAMVADGDLPRGMAISAESPTRSIRTAPRPDGSRVLLIGGNGHRVGDAAPTLDHERDLLAWATHHFDVRQVTHRWSAQDFYSEDGLPFVGPMSPGNDRYLVATGFRKWGMTNGTAAALALAGWIEGKPPDWAETLRASRPPRFTALGRLAAMNGKVARRLATGWLRPALGRTDLADGDGRVDTTLRGKVAHCHVDGAETAVSAVCSHLGGIVTWNDAERSWDCPLHGSRFEPDGSVLEGPATGRLERRD